MLPENIPGVTQLTKATTLPARDRISLLLDPDSPFLELCPFAGYGQKDVPPCGNLISGVGSVW
jgi:acetyl-CoA carboxylase carboxyltransferase component